MILIEKLKKCQPDRQVKLIDTNILRVRKFYYLVQVKLLNKLSLLLFHWENNLKIKQKSLNTKQKRLIQKNANTQLKSFKDKKNIKKIVYCLRNKQTEVFDKIYNEIFSKVDELVKQLDFNNLNYTYTSDHNL